MSVFEAAAWIGLIGLVVLYRNAAVGWRQYALEATKRCRQWEARATDDRVRYEQLAERSQLSERIVDLILQEVPAAEDTAADTATIDPHGKD